MVANAPMHVAELVNGIKVQCDFDFDHTDLNELRDLAVSAVLQLEALKAELHRLAGPQTSDVRTHRLLVHTTDLINKMRHGQ